MGASRLSVAPFYAYIVTLQDYFFKLNFYIFGVSIKSLDFTTIKPSALSKGGCFIFHDEVPVCLDMWYTP